MPRSDDLRDRMDTNARATFPMLAALDDYGRRWPGEIDSVAVFTALANEHDDAAAYRRERVAGHFTGSAWVVSADGRRTLLLHHRKLDRWLQPGGHADGDMDLARVALREAEEETGLRDLVVEPDVFDLDRHTIPARGAEPEHWHYDVRFVVRAMGSEDFVVNDESNALAWRDIADIAADPHVDDSMRRMARKWLERRDP
jgi:8-oxo-dGTP pyrophosphatase MutT (NUDIX family)